MRAAIEPLEDRRLLSATALQPAFGLDAIPESVQVNQGEYATDRVLVRSNAGAVAAERLLGLEATGSSALGNSQWWSVRIGTGQSAPDVVSRLRGSGFEAHLDHVVSIASHSADSDFNATNDYLYTSRMQWGLNNTGQNYGGASGTDGADIHAPAAWEITTGSSDVVVAVVDSGVDYTHPDLIDNIWTNPGEVAGDGIDNDANGYIDDVYGWDFYNNDPNPMDDNGHGTHVAGVLGAVGNNPDAIDGGQDGRGVAGVAWDVSIMALKFLDASGSGYASGAIAAIDYATTMRQQYNADPATGANVRVANNSWGGGSYDAALKSTIDQSGEAGILFTAAAGNGHWLFGYGLDNDASPHYPSSYESANIVAVAATDANDNLTSFSNWGATSVDVAAPGQHIWSTWPLALDTQDGTQEGYYRANGTSMATPYVSGAAALMWSANPDLSVAEVKQLLLSTSDGIGNDAYGKPTVTNGRLNAHRAVAEAANLATSQLSISDVTVVEGDGDPAVYAVFTVTRSGNASEPMTVNYATEDGTATAGVDYIATSGTLSFASNQSSKEIWIPIIGDTVEELNEVFFVNLAAPAGGVIADGQGAGTISDDDGPVISISDATLPEGNSGTTAAKFTVSLSKLSLFDTTVSYATADGSAIALDDYRAAAGKVTIAAGSASAEISIDVYGDTAFEPDETFTVNLSNPGNGRLGDAEGLATIQNDDIQPAGDSNDIYVADMTWATRGKQWTDVTVYVKRDADADGIGGTSDVGDQAVAGASVTWLLIHDSNGDGDYVDRNDKTWSGTATTASDGSMTFNVKGPSSGDFMAEVTHLTHLDNASYTWNTLLDGENPDYYRRNVGEFASQAQVAFVAGPMTEEKREPEDIRTAPESILVTPKPTRTVLQSVSSAGRVTSAAPTDDADARGSERAVDALEARDRLFAEAWQDLTAVVD